MAAKKNVSAAEVRAWGRANVEKVPEHARAGLGDTARGRIHPDLRSAYEKGNKGRTYEPKVAEGKTVTVPVTGLDKAGRKTTRKVTVSMAEARTALGEPTSKRGRISTTNLSDVLSQREADAVADTFR